MYVCRSDQLLNCFRYPSTALLIRYVTEDILALCGLIFATVCFVQLLRKQSSLKTEVLPIILTIISVPHPIPYAKASFQSVHNIFYPSVYLDLTQSLFEVFSFSIICLLIIEINLCMRQKTDSLMKSM